MEPLPKDVLHSLNYAKESIGDLHCFMMKQKGSLDEMLSQLRINLHFNRLDIAMSELDRLEYQIEKLTRQMTLSIHFLQDHLTDLKVPINHDSLDIIDGPQHSQQLEVAERGNKVKDNPSKKCHHGLFLKNYLSTIDDQELYPPAPPPSTPINPRKSA